MVWDLVSLGQARNLAKFSRALHRSHSLAECLPPLSPRSAFLISPLIAAPLRFLRFVHPSRPLSSTPLPLFAPPHRPPGTPSDPLSTGCIFNLTHPSSCFAHLPRSRTARSRLEIRPHMMDRATAPPEIRNYFNVPRWRAGEGGGGAPFPHRGPYRGGRGSR